MSILKASTGFLYLISFNSSWLRVVLNVLVEKVEVGLSLAVDEVVGIGNTCDFSFSTTTD